MLTNILIAVLAGAAWCLGIRALFQEGMILEGLGQKLDETLPEWINKPLWRCPPCMASVHGTILWLTFLSGEYGLLSWPFFVVCLCGVNYVIVNLLPE